MATYSNWPNTWNKSRTGATPGVLGNSLQNLPTTAPTTTPVQAQQATPWTAPTLTNGMFPDQNSFDAWQKALSTPVDLGAAVIQGGRTGNVDRKAAYAWGKANGLIPDTDESMFSLKNITPLLMAAGPFLSAAGAFGGAAGAGGGVAGGSGGSEAFGGVSGLGGSAGGLGGGITAGELAAGGGMAGVGGTGLGGAGASLGAGGLTTGVGAGAGLQGTAAGLGMTTGPAATGAATAASKGGIASILDKVFGPATGGAGMSTSDALLTGSLGQGLLDIITSSKQQKAGETAAGLADPFASERGQYQQQLAALMADPSLIEKDPAYQFRKKSGQDALERSLSARDYVGSGNMLIDLQQYGQQSASEELNRQLERLMGLSGSQFGPGNASNAFLSGALPSIAQKYQGIGALGTAGREILDRILANRSSV